MYSTDNDWSTIRGKRRQPGDADVLCTGTAIEEILGISSAVPIDSGPARPPER